MGRLLGAMMTPPDVPVIRLGEPAGAMTAMGGRQSPRKLLRRVDHALQHFKGCAAVHGNNG